MSLVTGDKLGPYEILAPIGKGGMGEVYRARDPRVGREVAIKVSSDRFTERFEREARAIASLNHPNICQLYDVGPNYLVMELVEGESPQGPLPVELALNYARQIADALHAAHEKGVVHRDLKPGNIKIKPDGSVKVLDFGLAKVGPTSTSAGLEADPTQSLTRSMAETEAGVILGTAAYMSPEQARGKPVDKRTDIWAFGALLYELLTGKRPFQGDTITDILAAVVKEEPKWDRVPPHAQRLLRRCLQKDPKDRLHDIADAKHLLEDVALEATPVRRRSIAPWAVAALFAVALGVALWAPWRTPPAQEQIRTQVYLPDDVKGGDRNFTLSPDGGKLAFSAVGPDGVPQVWVRFMDAPPLKVQLLPGTETTPTPPQFFWSPDSKRIAYSGKGAKLRMVDLTGSPPQTLADTTGPNATGGSWNRDGVLIVGSTNGGLMRVSESGGTAARLTVPDGSEVRHAFPAFLADGRHFLYLRTSKVPENSGVYVGSLDAQPEAQDAKRLVATLFSPVYVPSAERGRGYLLILRERNLLAYSFDEGRMELVGDPVTVVQEVGSYVASGFFSATSRVLVYRSSGANQGASLKWWGRDGAYEGDADQSGGITAMALSPDGVRAALVRPDPANPLRGDIWMRDTTRGSSTRLTFDPGRADSPVWTPDGRQVVFASNRDGSWNLYRKLANESKDDEVLLKTGMDKTPTSISRNGRILLYTQVQGPNNSDVWVLSNLDRAAGEPKPAPLLNGASNESDARFSPESETPRWVAYTSNSSGRNEVYVCEFSLNPAGSPWQVSNSGGSNPRWRNDGKELFFAAPDGTAMSVDVMPGATFQASTPKVLVRVPSGIRPNWDVDPNGKRFLVLVNMQLAPFTVWQNWQASLKK